MDRSSIRQQMRENRRQLTPQQQLHSARKLSQLLLKQAWFQRSKNIAMYLANDGEIDPRVFADIAHHRGKQCLLPSMHPAKSGHLWFGDYDGVKTTNKFGIEEPDSIRRKAYTSIHLEGASMATSGDYRNYFEFNGRRYSHTLNPKTSYPVTHKLASVSVVAKTCMEADALATALMVMGEVQGYEYAKAKKLNAYFIYRDNQGFQSKSTLGFKQYL